MTSRTGRMAAFFCLYLTEGIPQGFTATAIATQMRRGGLGPVEIGAFVGSLYLPWAFKWAAGPFVDVLWSDRLGRRRGWILGTQLAMVATLLLAIPIDFVSQLSLFTAIIFVHNLFAATQDVAIDALAVDVLPEHERGMANGFMFGGAYLGMALGGSGVLFLVPWIGMAPAYVVVAGAILSVTVFIVLPLQEAKGPPRASMGGQLIRAVTMELGAFAKGAVRAFVGSRAALVGVVFALLPAGAMALGLALQSNLAVELGLDDQQVGWLALWSSLIAGVCCVAGGWLSDRFGRRLTLAWTLAAASLPTAALGYLMWTHQWITPVAVDAPGRSVPPAALVSAYWVAVLTYNMFQGLFYGIRSAIFMDVTSRRAAATQFTAYMALGNLAVSYSATWQGFTIERWGYPVTLGLDAVLGVVCLACLPFMAAPRAQERAPVGAAVPEGLPP
ncbi:MAG: MFS transporter [Deltaproteobacteria bacterium]|nr:MFS transporter [Deltaproteobacteria bacterium]